jgi:hypothetical protein
MTRTRRKLGPAREVPAVCDCGQGRLDPRNASAAPKDGDAWTPLTGASPVCRAVALSGGNELVEIGAKELQDSYRGLVEKALVGVGEEPQLDGEAMQRCRRSHLDRFKRREQCAGLGLGVSDRPLPQGD